MVVALVYSVTRGVWLAFAVVLLLTGVLRGGRTALAAGAGLVVLLLLLVGVDPGIRARTRSAFDLPANIGRTQIWRANLDMARERPLLGWGYGNYKTFRQPFYDRYPDADTTAHAHNDFLQMQVDGGVLSLTAFVALFAVVLFRGWRGRRALAADDRTGASEPARSVALGALLAVVGFLVGGMTQYNFGDAEVVIYLWFTVAILLRLPTLPSGDVCDGEARRSSPLDPTPLSA
jgi:O-antigen ligase